MPFLIELVPALTASWETIAYALIAAAAAGAFAGLLYRAGAVVVLSLVGLIATVIISVSHAWPLVQSLIFGFVLITVLQLGYVLGVTLTVYWSNKKAEETHNPIVDAASKRDNSLG